MLMFVAIPIKPDALVRVNDVYGASLIDNFLVIEAYPPKDLMESLKGSVQRIDVDATVAKLNSLGYGVAEVHYMGEGGKVVLVRESGRIIEVYRDKVVFINHSREEVLDVLKHVVVAGRGRYVTHI